jgi:hypothetical protein
MTQMSLVPQTPDPQLRSGAASLALSTAASLGASTGRSAIASAIASPASVEEEQLRAANASTRATAERGRHMGAA